MTPRQYVIQKIFIGFVFGCLSAVIATAFCFRLPPAGAAVMLALIVFMAVPLLKYLVTAGNTVISYICYLIPSSATFEGIMDLANGGMATAGKDIVILAVHCVVWFMIYLPIFKCKK